MLLKFHVEPHRLGEQKGAKMAAMPIYGKNL